ncbi:hypothetical protein N7516_007294 [Penicillium verrucosum]|uniref:uncharacterized protein n=1 Tax=Penicillium verrucosum TaxID=60171 RepID=UPI002545293D|nr:uncharacterized protein N7516_007294 [Penicillium verrucosum]KAJ5932805.1 hypothetical protein N7516_007294 [Penicillium verrucosum]
MDADLSNVLQTELILLAGHFASCTSFEIRDNLKFRTSIHALCEKAPNIANAIAEVVQEKKDASIREISEECMTPRKRRLTQDPSYRPPKSSKLDKKSVDGTKKKMDLPTTPLNNCHHSRPAQNDMPTGKLPESPRPAIEEYPRLRPILKLIIEATRTLHQLSTQNDGVPRDVHKMILQTLNSQSCNTVANIEWSDGSTWVEILERGASTRVQLTIFNMLEYMGASRWYESQIQLAMRTVTRRQATIGVLDSIQVQQTQGRSRSMCGVGPLKMQDESRDQSPNPGFSIPEREKEARRKALRNRLSRGHKLSTKIVKELGLVLRKYTKMSPEDLDLTIQNIKDDREHIELLAILSPQLQRLVDYSLPDLHSFYADLNSKKLLSETEIQELQNEYILKQASTNLIILLNTTNSHP